MNKSNLIWFGRYEGWLKWLARGVRDCDYECIKKAAKLFDMMLVDECVVIPMPSHTGESRQMLSVANLLPGSRTVVDVLRCNPHEPSYAQKKDGFMPSYINMWCGSIPKLGRPVYIIDNVICTGVTAGAALRAVKDAGADAVVVALASSPWRRT